MKKKPTSLRDHLSIATNAALLIVLGVLLAIILRDRVFESGDVGEPELALVEDWELVLDKPVSRGSERAAVKVVEFFDYQCPYCLQLEDAVQELMQDDSTSANFAMYHFPLDSHPMAYDSAVAAECAARQGKFLEYHDALFRLETDVTTDVLVEVASEMGLDEMELFTTCLDRRETSQLVERDLRLARELGLRAVPALVVNGEIRYGVVTLSDLRALIERAGETAYVAGD